MISQITSATTASPILSKNNEDIVLPDEVCLRIFSHLPPWDIGQTSLVCRQWHRCSQDLELLKIVAQNLYQRRWLDACDMNFWIILKNISSELNSKENSVKLKKIIKDFYKDDLKSNSIIKNLIVMSNDFGEHPLSVFHSYVKKHQERILLYPEYLMFFGKNKCVNLYLDLNEEELIFRLSFLLRDIDDFEIVRENEGDLGKIVTIYGIKDILYRILEKGSYTLLAAHLYKCYYLEFQDKYEFVQQLLDRIQNLPWIQRYRIITTLKTNLPLDLRLTKEELDQILKLLVVEENSSVSTIKYSEKPSGFFKVANCALAFFKTTCALICGITTCAILTRLVTPYYTSLSLKVAALAGVCFIAMMLVSKVTEKYSDLEVEGLITKALNHIEDSENHLIWKQKLLDESILIPLIYKSCKKANIAYKKLDCNQSASDIFAVFYALHFAIDRFATEFQLTKKDQANLIKMIDFLEAWRFELLNEAFMKRDDLYKNPAYFFKQKYRQKIATYRTQEALKIYQIKKSARKIGLEFPEVITNIRHYKEKIETMAEEIEGCSGINEWFEKLEKKNLLSDLLQLAQFTLPPNYRCVSSGKPLLAAISTKGAFFDAGLIDEKLKTSKNSEEYEYEFETSSDLMWACTAVFLQYYHRSKFVETEVAINAKVNACLEFIYEHFDKELKKLENVHFIEDKSLSFSSIKMERRGKEHSWFNKRKWYFMIDTRPLIFSQSNKIKLDE